MNDPTRSLPGADATRSMPNADVTMPEPADPNVTKPASDDEAARSREKSSPFPTIPGYEILERLEAGGMGVVYKARQVRMNRIVAVKLIHGGKTANPKELIRFLAEAEAVAAIEHPNIVKVYDSGDAHGQPYLAMEYLPGGTLSQKLQSPPREQGSESKPQVAASDSQKLQNPPREQWSESKPLAHASGSSRLPPKVAAELIRKLALAVQAAHDRQIVHRDLKPSNILFDAHGEPRIADFGLAKRTGSGDGITNTNAIMGTAAYMAPEQAKGESKFVGPQADVWALGVILYECLCGQKPFSGSGDFDVIRKVIENEPSSLRSHVREIPRDLDLIVQKCLAKDETERYPSAAALADDLGNWLADKPISVKPAGSVERLMKWTRRNKLAAGIVMAACIGMFAFAGLAIWANGERNRANTLAGGLEDSLRKLVTATGQLSDVENRLDEVERKEHQAQQKMRDAEIQALRIQDANRILQAGYDFDRNAVELARETLEAVTTPELKTGYAMAMTRRHCEGSDWTIHGYVASSAFAWQPRERKIAIGDDQTVRLWDAATGQSLRELKGHTDSVRSVAWSPEGRRLASGSWDQTVRLWDAATGQSLRELKGHTSGVQSVAWSPDGRTLASGSGDRTVRLWDAATGQSLRELKGHTNWVLSVAWSPDGRTLASGGGDQTVRLWDAATGQSLRELTGHTNLGSNVAWSPDGRTLATGSYDRTVRLWDATTGQCLRELKEHTRFVQSVAWSPDGRTLASGSGDQTVRLWDAATGQSLRELTGHTNLGSNVAWSPDGRTLATGSYDRTVRFWDAATWQCLRELKGHREWVLGVAWSPDGRTLASGSGDQTVRLWNAATGQSLRELKGHTSIVLSVAWSPDGRTLASGSHDQTVRLWDAATWQSLRELKGHTGMVENVAFSKNGKQIVSQARLNDPQDEKKEIVEMIVWDAATGQRLYDVAIPDTVQSPPPDDGYYYFPSGNVIIKASKNIPAEEAARRTAILAPHPEVHRRVAAECEQNQQYFAAAFHLKRLLLSEPDNSAAKAKLAELESKLMPRETTPPPRKVLTTPAP